MSAHNLCFRAEITNKKKKMYTPVKWGLKTHLFPSLARPSPLPPPTPPIYSPDNRAHITSKDLSYLSDYVVIIRLLSLHRWGPIAIRNFWIF